MHFYAFTFASRLHASLLCELSFCAAPKRRELCDCRRPRGWTLPVAVHRRTAVVRSHVGARIMPTTSGTHLLARVVDVSHLTGKK